MWTNLLIIPLLTFYCKLKSEIRIENSRVQFHIQDIHLRPDSTEATFEHYVAWLLNPSKTRKSLPLLRGIIFMYETGLLPL